MVIADRHPLTVATADDQPVQPPKLATSIGADVADWMALQCTVDVGPASRSDFETLPTAEQSAALASLQARYPDLQTLLSYDGAGHVVAPSGAGAGSSSIRASVYEQARTTRAKPIAAGARGAILNAGPLWSAYRSSVPRGSSAARSSGWATWRAYPRSSTSPRARTPSTSRDSAGQHNDDKGIEELVGLHGSALWSGTW